MKRLWAEAAAAVLLIAIISASWCWSDSKWSSGDWQQPTAYSGPYRGVSKSDVLLHLAFIRAARDGNFIPLHSKLVPELGAPYDGNWNDWPITEEFPIYLMGLLARVFGIFAALNIALVSCHLLAGLTFYFVARYYRIDIEWAFTAALAFGLAPYIFAESPDHPLVALCWHIPLFLLVWDWVSSESGVETGSKRFWFGIVVGVLAGLQMPYYSGIFCQLVLLGAIIMFIRTHNASRLVAPLSFVLATVLAFALMNVDTWTYASKFGANAGALIREFQWLEIYGLKLVDLVTPPLNHRWQAFRSFAEWRAHNQILHDEGSYIGIVGVVSLLLLAGVSVFAQCRNRSRRAPKEIWQVLWIFIFFTTGGLNAIAGLFGFRYFRAGCRFTVVILAIALLFAARYVAGRIQRRSLSIIGAAACCGIILLDQVPASVPKDEKATIARQIASDRKFVADMESILPKDAMVFQLPVMDFPEAPLRDVSAYDHLRPYLYSHQLRFSFGSVKGRPREQWQHELTNLPLAQAIEQLKGRGFSALYVNRNTYPNRADDLQENCHALGYDKIINAAEGDLFCVVLP